MPRVLIASLIFLVAVPNFLFAHKVTTVSVVSDIFTDKGTFSIQLAMEVEPTGDPTIDDLITPEDAAKEFAQSALVIFFDDVEIKNPKMASEIIETSDEDTPEELKRTKALVELSGEMPEGAENFLLYVNEDTEASVVMVLRKDLKPARRMQVLYPGDFSRPFSVLPLETADPFKKPEESARSETSKAEASDSVSTEEAGAPEFFDWVISGFQKIFPDGTRHWVFAIGFLLLSLKMRPVISQVAAFVIAHSLGLALAGLGVIAFSESVALIAVGLGICYVGAENLMTKTVKWWRLPAIFIFGIFHGFLMAENAPTAVTGLIGFNVGIEIALILILMIGLYALNVLFRQDWYRKVVAIPLNVALICGGIYWAFFA